MKQEKNLTSGFLKIKEEEIDVLIGGGND